MERNVDKIKRLEHELGRWHKKVADTAKENEKLREALAQYPGSLLDTLHDAGHNKKQTMALLLYQMRLQKLYELQPVREEQ